MKAIKATSEVSIPKQGARYVPMSSLRVVAPIRVYPNDTDEHPGLLCKVVDSDLDTDRVIVYFDAETQGWRTYLVGARELGELLREGSRRAGG